MFEGYLEFYEAELEQLKTPLMLKVYLTEIHEEFELTDLSDLIRYFEEIEEYEKCIVVRDFAKENNIKI